MTNAELKNYRHIIRCIYRGITNPLDAYKTNLKKINRNVGYCELGLYLHKYNASIYTRKTGKRI